MAEHSNVRVFVRTVDSAHERAADRVAEHAAITIAMNAPSGIDPDAFFAMVIDNIRAKQDEKVRQLTRVRGNER